MVKFNTLLTNLVVFHNAPRHHGRRLRPGRRRLDHQRRSARRALPYQRAHISRFGAYATDKLTHQPDPFDPTHTVVGFTALDLAA